MKRYFQETSSGYLTLVLEHTGKKNEDGQPLVKYTLTDAAGVDQFQGEDFKPSPLHSAKGPKSAAACIDLLTCDAMTYAFGDTPEDPRQEYTPAQIEFLKRHINDFETWSIQLDHGKFK